MIVSQSELDLILNRKIRRRTIHLPIQHGKFGELKKCPAKPGGIYTLKARTPWERYRTQAETQPSRARAVLWLIERCEQPQRTVTITVDGIEAQQDQWIVHFVLGERELEHHSRLLRATAPQAPVCMRRVELPKGSGKRIVCNRAFADNQDVCKCGAKRPAEKPDEHGYTTVPSQALPRCGEEIPEAIQGKYSKSADESRKSGLGEQRDRLLAAVGALRLEAARLNAGNSVARRRLKSVEHQLRAFDREMRRCA